MFYEIFRYLEDALDRYSHTLVGELDIPGMRRTEAFEKVGHSRFNILWSRALYHFASQRLGTMRMYRERDTAPIKMSHTHVHLSFQAFKFFRIPL